MALAAVTVFEMKRLFITEAVQQPLVNTLMLLMDFGLGMLLVVLAMVHGLAAARPVQEEGPLDGRSGGTNSPAEVKQ